MLMGDTSDNQHYETAPLFEAGTLLHMFLGATTWIILLLELWCHLKPTNSWKLASLLFLVMIHFE